MEKIHILVSGKDCPDQDGIFNFFYDTEVQVLSRLNKYSDKAKLDIIIIFMEIHQDFMWVMKSHSRRRENTLYKIVNHFFSF